MQICKDSKRNIHFSMKEIKAETARTYGVLQINK